MRRMESDNWGEEEEEEEEEEGEGEKGLMMKT